MTKYIERERIEKFFDGIYDCADLTFEPNDHCCAADDCAHCKWYETKNAIQKRILSIPAADAIENTSKAYQMMAEAYEAEVAKRLWISVTERLPEKRTNVLAMTADCDIYVCDFIPSVRQFWTIPGDELHIDDISHWMLLPEPPKEE
jgi:hypothetical protein